MHAMQWPHAIRYHALPHNNNHAHAPASPMPCHAMHSGTSPALPYPFPSPSSLLQSSTSQILSFPLYQSVRSIPVSSPMNASAACLQLAGALSVAMGWAGGLGGNNEKPESCLIPARLPAMPHMLVCCCAQVQVVPCQER